MKTRTYSTHFILEINKLSLSLNSKDEYIALLKQIRTGKFVRHLCSVSFDLGKWIVIRSVFNVVNPFTKKKISIELGFRKLREDR